MIKGIKEVKNGVSNIGEVRYQNLLIYKKRKSVDEIVDEGLVTPSKMEILVTDQRYWNEFLSRADLQERVKKKATKYNMDLKDTLTSSGGLQGLFILFEPWASGSAAGSILSGEAVIKLYGGYDSDRYYWQQRISQIGDPQYGKNNNWHKSTGDTKYYYDISFLNIYKKPITSIRAYSREPLYVRGDYGLIIFKIR